ncbi:MULTISPECIES: hypothetical protein [unclassified Crossiella]|uniref:hypothetical protein n=1 Tax=unclassified Crossiella TaxID=2620835 RepID=UPI001FFF1A8A|nr:MULTISPECIES: hypothetical protein [unclassified Crossiella]MCK2238230.1 hypothetical protein [Crossiella sp. S99.2]MCK2256270.1 hypothetical protein [Crossiella sp. S99.1]
MTQPTVTTDLDVEINHGQVYIYAQAPWADDPSNNAVLRALDDARQSGRFVGVADALIDLVTPVQWNFHAPMRIEIWSLEPPADDDAWDQVVDVDLDVPNGRLWFEGSGGREPIPCDVPAGTYRARVSGRGYTEAADGAEGLDSYRLRLWPRGDETSPALRRGWPGWQNIT